VAPAAVEGQLRGHTGFTALVLETSCNRERRALPATRQHRLQAASTGSTRSSRWGSNPASLQWTMQDEAAPF